jgi:tetratricopeptide (TPR) repeat protein
VQAYEQAGRLEDAIAECRRAIQFVDALEVALKAQGPEGYWKKQLEPAARGSPLDKAALYVRLGRNEQAFKLLDQAYSEHDMWLVPLKVDPRWDKIRSEYRFKDLLKRVGLK